MLLRDEISIENSCKTIKEKYSSFDAIVNCAGTMSLESTDFLSFKEMEESPCRVITFNPGGMKTNIFVKYDENLKDIAKNWMNTNEVADIMLYTLNLPKQIEISEITISRKNNYK